MQAPNSSTKRINRQARPADADRIEQRLRAATLAGVRITLLFHGTNPLMIRLEHEGHGAMMGLAGAGSPALRAWARWAFRWIGPEHLWQPRLVRPAGGIELVLREATRVEIGRYMLHPNSFVMQIIRPAEAAPTPREIIEGDEWKGGT
jgi:hypothetical protein